MNRAWAYYPLSVIAAAISTAVGGIVVLALLLYAGSALATYAMSGTWMSLGESLAFGFFAIGIACISFWGILYVGVLMWISYGLIYAERSRLLVAAPVILMQYAATLAAGYQMYGISCCYDGYVGRAVAILAILGILASISGLIVLHRRERERGISDR